MDYIFEKGKFTEDELEKAIIELFEQQGYTYVPGEEIHRQYEDVLIEDDLREFINAQYSDDGLNDVELKKIVNRLALIPTTI